MRGVYEVDTEFRDILNKLEVIDVDEDPEGAEELLNRLREVQSEALDKVTNCIKFIRNEELRASGTRGEITSINEEAKRLRSVESRYLNRAKFVKSLVLGLVETNGSGIRTPVGTASSMESSSVEVVDEGAIPPNYLRIKVEVDKESARKDLIKGVKIPGLELHKEKVLTIR